MTLTRPMPAETFLAERHVRYEVAPHKPVFTGRAEAEVLHLPARYVVKTVMLRDRSGLIAAVLPASRRIDTDLVMKAVPDPHVRLAAESEVEEAFPGYELGALPPLPGLLGVRGLVDSDVLDRDEVAFADGTRSVSLVASPREVFWGQDVTVAPISWAPVAWREWDRRRDSVIGAA